MLFAAGAEVVDGGEDGHAGEQGDGPSDHAPEDEDDVAEFVVGVVDHPGLDLMAEDDDQGGQRERNQSDGHEEEGAKDAARICPIFAREAIGAAEAFHEREHHASNTHQLVSRAIKGDLEKLLGAVHLGGKKDASAPSPMWESTQQARTNQ